MRGRRRRTGPGAWGGYALPALLLAGCAGPGTDIHVAPLFTRIHAADGGVDREYLGGLWREERGDEEQLEKLTFGPLYGFEPKGDNDWQAHVMVPLGFASHRDGETRAMLLPVYIWGGAEDDDGSYSWQLFSLPGLLVESNSERGTQFGIFPLWGRFEDFATFDKLVFVLFPLFVYSERTGRVTYGVLFPFFSWTYGGGMSGWRVWPLAGHTEWKGRYDRWFWLWPIIHWQDNHLGGGGEEPEKVRWVWPFWGKKERGTYRAYTWLWPFFGYSYDPRSGFWALDFPFPLIRLQRGPGDLHRTRFWPVYSYLRADGQVYRTFAWPFIHERQEDMQTYSKESQTFIPIVQRWNRYDKETGKTSAWRKQFPLFQWERDGTYTRGSFPTLDPFWKNELVDRYYSWIWKAYEWEEDVDYRRERSWLGLYRRERGRGEDRRSVAGVWASRSYEKDGGRVDETSVLFGLLRWRVTEADGFDMLPCAFPGPGWPEQGAEARARDDVEIDG